MHSHKICDCKDYIDIYTCIVENGMPKLYSNDVPNLKWKLLIVSTDTDVSVDRDGFDTDFLY